MLVAAVVLCVAVDAMPVVAEEGVTVVPVVVVVPEVLVVPLAAAGAFVSVAVGFAGGSGRVFE